MNTETVITLDSQVEEFKSSWGAFCKPQYNEDLGKYILPLGWEDELSSKGIVFEIITITNNIEE
jgi:hypothetical protein